MGIAW